MLRFGSMRPLKHNLIEPEISLKPLFDVSLVLVIILLVVAPMLRTGAEASSRAKGPSPPRSGISGARSLAGPPGPSGPSRTPAPLVFPIEDPQLPISMEADGSLYVDGRPVALHQFQSVLAEIAVLTPHRPVLVKGDRRLRYEQVRWVLQSVSAAGFRRAALAADPRPPR